MGSLPRCDHDDDAQEEERFDRDPEKRVGRAGCARRDRGTARRPAGACVLQAVVRAVAVVRLGPVVAVAPAIGAVPLLGATTIAITVAAAPSPAVAISAAAAIIVRHCFSLSASSGTRTPR